MPLVYVDVMEDGFLCPMYVCAVCGNGPLVPPDDPDYCNEHPRPSAKE